MNNMIASPLIENVLGFLYCMDLQMFSIKLQFWDSKAGTEVSLTGVLILLIIKSETEKSI